MAHSAPPEGEGEGENMNVDQLMQAIYEDHFSHIDLIENMNSGDCDCNIHQVLTTIDAYEREEESK
jgi:hypothetical protein